MFSQNNSTKISKPHVPNTLPIVLYILLMHQLNKDITHF